MVHTEGNLPQIGESLCGFEVCQLRGLPLIRAKLAFLRHQKTGAGVMLILNEDIQRVLEITFNTLALDDRGIPHILEHCCMKGSRKYPSSDLFLKLRSQSFHTYLNAATSRGVTSFTVGSLSEEQLLRTADFLIDSCLHPLFLEDESIFREEGWRYRLESPEADLTIEGTVYSEMQGTLNATLAGYFHHLGTIFPGTKVGHIFGGDPEHIPELTYEDLKAYHQTFYHPSNSTTFLYGKFEDLGPFLSILDEAFSAYERLDPLALPSSDEGYRPIHGHIVSEYAHPAQAGMNPENTTDVLYSIVCPGLRGDLPSICAMTHMLLILEEEYSPLQEAIREVLPHAFVSCALDQSGPEIVVSFAVSSVNPGDEVTIWGAICSALKRIAQEGFDPKILAGLIGDVSLSARLTIDSSNKGLNFIRSFLRFYTLSRDPFAYLTFLESLDHLKEENEKGLFVELTRRWLSEPTASVLTRVYPVPGRKEELAQKLAERLARTKAQMSPEEIASLVESTHQTKSEEEAQQEALLTTELTRKLNAVTLDTLPEKYRFFPLLDEVTADGIRRLESTCEVDGFGKVGVYLDASGLPQEDIHWFHLYSQLVGRLSTTDHEESEFQHLTRITLHGLSGGMSLLRPQGDGEYRPYLFFSWISLEEELQRSYEVFYEMLFGSPFEDFPRIRELVDTALISFRQMLTLMPEFLPFSRSMAYSQPSARYSLTYQGLDYYTFLGRIKERLETEPEAVAEKLRQIAAFFCNATGAISTYAGTPEGCQKDREASRSFFDRLERRPITPVVYDLPIPARREGIILDTSVFCNIVSASQKDLLDADLPNFRWDVFTTIVTERFLFPLLRSGYGVYSVGNNVDDESMSLVTSDDPNITETFAVFEQIPGLIENLDISEEDMQRYILSSYTYFLIPEGELEGASGTIVNALNGRPDELLLENVKGLKKITAEDVRRTAPVYRALLEKGARHTSGPASAILAHQDLFDVILDPFGSASPETVGGAPEGETGSEGEIGSEGE